MKKITYFFAACIALMAFSGCSLKEDETFSESASQRSGDNIAAVEKVLYTAPNGWLMEYYGTLSLGGYNVMVKFDGSNATFASEKFADNHPAGIGTDDKAVTATTHFKIEQSMGTVISFDEYNPIFHYFSMPNNPDYTYDTAAGLGGDFEFRVMKASNDSIILRGKKGNNRIVMTPIPADRTWESIIKSAGETEKYMASRLYTLTGSDYTLDQTITATDNAGFRSLVFEYVDTLGMKQTVVAPYIVKEDGFWFYSPVDVRGYQLDGLVKGDTDDYFVFRNNQNLQLDTYMPTLYESITTGNWYMRYPSVGAYAKPKWDAMLAVLKTAGRNQQEIKLYTATLGFSTDNKLCAGLLTTYDAPYYGFTGENLKEDGTRIKFNQNSSIRNSAGRTYYQRYKWNEVLNTIYGHTFDLECDYQRRPQWIKMTDVNEPSNVYILYNTPSYFIDDPNYYNDNN